MKKKIKMPMWVAVLVGIIFIIVFIFVLLKFVYEVDFNNKYEEERKLELSEINYVIPEEFEKYKSIESYSLDENDVYCRAYISASKKYNWEFEEWFKGQIYSDLNTEVSSIEELDVNGKVAYRVDTKRSNSEEHNYGFESTNYFYLVSYKITDYKNGDREDLDTNKCFTSEYKIINSITLQ